MERGTVEWNSGMVERAINDPVPFYSPSGHTQRPGYVTNVLQYIRATGDMIVTQGA